MKEIKYKSGIVVLKEDDREIPVHAPNGRLTEKWFRKYAPHWAGVREQDVNYVILIPD
jgi:hypothetical protein